MTEEEKLAEELQQALHEKYGENTPYTVVTTKKTTAKSLAWGAVYLFVVWFAVFAVLATLITFFWHVLAPAFALGALSWKQAFAGAVLLRIVGVLLTFQTTKKPR